MQVSSLQVLEGLVTQFYDAGCIRIPSYGGDEGERTKGQIVSVTARTSEHVSCRQTETFSTFEAENREMVHRMDSEPPACPPGKMVGYLRLVHRTGLTLIHGVLEYRLTSWLTHVTLRAFGRAHTTSPDRHR